ncbi:MAG: endonuclease III domain-containing protein, partial [candidate division NC10 bacterium]|nr:endonuclease III domain-containing protein [candidate division NC10 bacterium]
NTAWTNVEKALKNLKAKRRLTVKGLTSLPLEELAALVKPSGYYTIKAKRLKAFLAFLQVRYIGSLDRMFREEPSKLREELLAIPGIGQETADSILLYAGGFPIFVVDAYTKRVLERHGLIDKAATYQEIQELFLKHLPQDAPLFNEYHALFVAVGKHFCRKEPLCEKCPLRVDLERSGRWPSKIVSPFRTRTESDHLRRLER